VINIKNKGMVQTMRNIFLIFHIVTRERRLLYFRFLLYYIYSVYIHYKNEKEERLQTMSYNNGSKYLFSIRTID
jgi:hypothetical protein